MRLFLGFLIGAALATLYWKWTTIKAVYDNKTTVSAGSQVIDGTKEAASGLKTLWRQLQ